MFLHRPNISENSKFAPMVMWLSIPTALVLLCLVLFKILSPLFAVAAYGAAIVFDIALLLPTFFDLQKLKRYINNLNEGKYADIEVSEKESEDIVQAINSMHYFWVKKADKLEAQTISDTAILDSLPDPLIMIDRAKNILGANLAARIFWGNEILQQTLEETVLSKNFINAVDDVLARKTEAASLLFYTEDKEPKKLYCHIKQLPWISKNMATAVICFYDLSKTLKFETMQSDFVANASHELKTPLAVISGAIETLQTSAKNDKKARETFLNIMQDQAQFMASLIANLLSLSNIEMQTDQQPDEYIEIKPVINAVVKALSAKADEKNMPIAVNFEAALPAVPADKQQIKQVVQNLLDNAIKYGNAESEIAITVSKAAKIPESKSLNVADGEAVLIAVNNKGNKIKPQDMKRLTERFYRMQEHKNLQIKGTGLGLSIAKQIIIRHRGNLTVASNQYTGTTFSIYLPVNF